jgi:DNA-binding XRE family transcriptional regulator
MMHIISEGLRKAVYRSDKLINPTNLAKEIGISTNTLIKAVDQESVNPRTLVKIAGFFNFEERLSYISVPRKNNQNRKERDYTPLKINDAEVIESIDKRINKLAEFLNLSRDSFIRCKMSLILTSETYRTAREKKSISNKIYKKLVSRIEQLEKELGIIQDI